MPVTQSVSTVEVFAPPGPRPGERTSNNVLSLTRVNQEDGRAAAQNNNLSNNNTEVETGEKVRTRRRRRVSDCEEEGEATETESELTKSADEIVLDGTPITQVRCHTKVFLQSDPVQTVESCLDCGVSLASEWHRPPNRHDCQAMSETVCQVRISVRWSRW